MIETSAAAASFESMLRPVLGPAYGFAVTLTGDRTEAEDLLQEAALLAFRALHTFQPGTSFKSWFYKILTNRHFERFRRARRRPSTVDLDDGEDLDLYLYRRTAEAGLHEESTDPARLLMGRLTAEQVLAAIAGLPEEFRAVASLHLVEEMEYQEIAELLGCPVGTVRSRLHRGRRMLQKALWQVAVSAGVVRPPAGGAGRPIGEATA